MQLMQSMHLIFKTFSTGMTQAQVDVEWTKYAAAIFDQRRKKEIEIDFFKVLGERRVYVFFLSELTQSNNNTTNTKSLTTSTSTNTNTTRSTIVFTQSMTDLYRYTVYADYTIKYAVRRNLF